MVSPKFAAGSAPESKSIMISLVGLLLIASQHLAHGAGSPTATTSPQRQVGHPHNAANSTTTTTTSAIDQVVALLKARPRQTQANSSAKPAPVNSSKATKLLVEASTLERQVSPVARSGAPNVAAKLDANRSTSANSVQTPPTAAPGARPQPGKRQADFANSGDLPTPTTTTTSRRNEDPWFLDQAPLPLQPYRFSYNIKDKNGLTEQYRQEAGDGKFTTGSYGYVLPDGIYRHVDYVADDRGFHVFLRTSEPGTANQNPADVVINANPVISAPGLSYASVRADAPGGGGGAAGFLPYTPASAWNNYSTLLPASAYSPAAQTPLIDLLRNSAAAAVNSSGSLPPSLYDGTLARRPPGSIVGTPARNFTSFAYGNQPPLTTSSGAWPWGGRQPPTDSSGGGGGGYQFQSIAPKPAQVPVQPTPTIDGFGANSNNLTAQQHYTGWNDRAGNLNDRNDQRTSQGTKQSTSDPDRASRAGQNNDAASHPDNPPVVPSGGGYFGTTTSRLAPLFTPTRVGPDVLLYDRPFVVQTSAPGGASALKLNYDNNHVLYADSPFLSLERAKNLAHLEQINAVARLASGQLSSLPPLLGASDGPTNFLGNNLSLADQIRLGLLSGTTTSRSSSSSRQHEEHQHSTSRHQLVDDANKVLLSKEHKSGSSSASGRELDYDSRQPAANQRQPAESHTDLPPLLPPPPPQFNTHNNQHHLQSHFKPMGVKGAPGGGDQQSARLLAPYVDEHTFGRPGHTGQVKGGGNLQQQISTEDDDQRRQPTFGPRSPTPPAEPRAPVEPALPATASDQDQPQRSTNALQADGTKSTPPARRELPNFGSGSSGGGGGGGDEIELQQQTGGSRAPNNNPSAAGGITRIVRMPDSDYRTSVLMNDLRSMQNSIGLPQPPRLQRSSDHHSSSSSSSLIEHPAGGHAHPSATTGLSLGDQMVAARMRRVEDLLRHAHTGTGPAPVAPASSSPPQQASVQQAVAVRASRKELEELGVRQQQQQQVPVRSNRTSLFAQHQRETEGSSLNSDDDQPRRRMSTGPVLKFPANAAGKSQPAQEPMSSSANETANFEAQRLSAKAARLRADKVSELEKFQQRLRTQQLHLIEQKTSDKSQASMPQKQQQLSRVPNSESANSHVKYDEPNENEVPTHQLNGPGDSQARNQYPRPRRQNELEAKSIKAERVKDMQTTTTTTTPAPQVSEFARKLQGWPSLLGQKQQQQGHSNELPTDLPSSSSSSGKPHKPSADQPIGSGNEAGNKNQQQVAAQGGNKTQHDAREQKLAGPNTINLDFINSVTALSMDHLNPFAVASVNPAVQRSSSAANSDRLSPHRLSLPPLGEGGGQDQQAGGKNQPTGGAAASASANSAAGYVSATSTARYQNSPDLLAALDYHERRDTSNQLRGLLDQTHANHQISAASLMGAPYMLHSPLSNHRTADSPLSSRLLIGTSSQLFEAANSQHKSFVPMPKQLKLSTSENKLDSKPVASSGSASATTTVRLEPSSSSLQRDGFEIRDRAIQVDNHRFFEVVSSLRNPSETSAGSFQAFRDPQLSISANNNK